MCCFRIVIVGWFVFVDVSFNRVWLGCCVCVFGFGLRIIEVLVLVVLLVFFGWLRLVG